MEDALDNEESMQVSLQLGGRLDEEDFRTWPDDEVFVPLLESFARALGQMPRLKSTLLEFYSGSRYIYIAYTAPGVVAMDEDELEVYEKTPRSAPRLLAHTHDWKMSEDLHNLFRAVGAKFQGEDTVLWHLPDLYGY